MPLNTQLFRDGEVVPVPWDETTLSILMSICIGEQDPDQVYAESGISMGELIKHNKFVELAWTAYFIKPDCDLFNKGQQVIKEDYTFGKEGERTFSVQAGDEFHMWRSH